MHERCLLRYPVDETLVEARHVDWQSHYVAQITNHKRYAFLHQILHLEEVTGDEKGNDVLKVYCQLIGIALIFGCICIRFLLVLSVFLLLVMLILNVFGNELVRHQQVRIDQTLFLFDVLEEPLEYFDVAMH